MKRTKGFARDAGARLAALLAAALTAVSLLTGCNRQHDDSPPSNEAETLRLSLRAAQMDTDAGRLELTAAVSKSAYEALAKTADNVEAGFLLAESGDAATLTKDTPGVTVLPAGKPTRTDTDKDALLYTVTRDGYAETALRQTGFRIRAYLSYSTASGGDTVIYSNDRQPDAYTPSTFGADAENATSADALAALRRLNTIPDTTPVVVPTKADAAARVPGKPYVVDVTYDDGMGICVAIYDAAADFGASTDAADASPAIQAALDAAKLAGGGVVYLPEGVYHCKTPLTVPSLVTLRGEWHRPDDDRFAGAGTVLMAETGGKDVSDTPFCSLNTGAGLRNMTILYPATVNGDTTEFPATIAQKPSVGSDSYTVLNTTILGGSVGYDTTDVWNELPYLKNLYIANLGKGVKINNVTDIGRMESVHIDPAYLLDNAILPMTDHNRQKIRSYIASNAIGFYLQRSDWQYVYDLTVTGVDRGIVFDRFVDPNRQAGDPEFRGSNGQMFGVDIRNCHTAFDVVYTNAIGHALTNVTVTNCNTGIRFSGDFFAVFEITNLTMTGQIAHPFVESSVKNGKVILSRSTFDCDTDGGYVLTVEGGGLSVQDVTFRQDSRHLDVTAGAGAVSVLGCHFPHLPDIRSASDKTDSVYLDQTPLSLPALTEEHVYRRSIPTAASTALYDVTDFGAKKGTDSTDAFEKALAAAKATGGIVYVPQGEYTVSRPLRVPSGVELRGVCDVPTHPVNAGSVICTDYGRDDETAAFISLEESSGISGISFFYPQQSLTDFIPYAWTVQGLGPNCWAINSVFINSYNALDFGTYPSDGHYIQYVSGTPLRRGVFVGHNDGNGWVENVQFNPHYWTRSATLRTSLNTDVKLAFNRRLNNGLEALIFGDNASEHVLGTFAYGSQSLLVFEKQEKNGTNGVFIGHGSDGCRNALKVNGVDCVVMVNSELVSMNFNEDMHHIIMQPENDGTLILHNTMAWGQPLTSSMEVHSGHLVVAQMFYWNTDKTSQIADVDGGSLYMAGVLMPVKTRQFAVSDDGKVYLKADLNLRSGTRSAHSSVELMTYSKNGSPISQRFSWWI